MQLGQRPAPPFPFWCNFILICCVLALQACSDRNESAAQNAVLAQQAFDRHDLRTARAAVVAAIAERDDVVDYHLLQGRIELAAQSDGAAYNAYNDALALDPTNGEALLAVAQLGLKTGNIKPSLDATDKILLLAPDNIDALLLRGIHSIIKRDYAGAIGYGDKILALSPGNEGGTILKSRALFMSGKLSDALATLEGMSGSDAHSAPASLTRLEFYRALRQPAQLSAEFSNLRRLRPDDVPLQIDEANFRFKSSERGLGHELVAGVLANRLIDRPHAEEALALWQEYGFRDAPDALYGRINRTGSVAARQALVRFLLRHNRLPEANATLATLPTNASAGLRARYLMRIDKTAEALELAKAVLERDTTDCDALIAASEGALQRRAAADAVRSAELASSECPKQPSAWLAGAYAYQALGRESGVDRTYGQALDANKQSSEITASYAQWLVAQKRSREAVAMARRLTRYAPALLSGWQLYGDLCRSTGASCVDEATRGLANARSLFEIDPAPGTAPPNGLFGRLSDESVASPY